MATTFWNVPREWEGEDVFVIAGGTSVRDQNVSALRGRRVIVVNSSYEAAPFADICFFADRRWYLEHAGRDAFKTFMEKRRTATVSESTAPGNPMLLRLKRVQPADCGFAVETCAVASQKTSLQGAMNLAAHLGAARIVLLGADMGRGADGVSHHHSPHEWKNKPGNATWDSQMGELAGIVEPLRVRGIAVINTSPISRIPNEWGWAKQTLENVLCPPSQQFIASCAKVPNSPFPMWIVSGGKFPTAGLKF